MQINNWFVDNGGKEISPVEKPLDTEMHMRLRLVWVRTHIIKLTSNGYYVAYLDEKWFYTTSRRRKLKTLPKGPHEKEGADEFIRPKMRSRRYPVKCMFLGVVACPLPYRRFDGRILLERVSEDVVVNKLTAHTQFSDDVLINSYLKNGEWRLLFADTDSL